MNTTTLELKAYNEYVFPFKHGHSIQGNSWETFLITFIGNKLVNETCLN